jgi:hypothetical protein
MGCRRFDESFRRSSTGLKEKQLMATQIITQLVKVMKDVGSVGKDGTNSQQGYKFRGIDALLNAVHPALTRHGVVIVPEVLSSNVEFRDVVRSSGKSGTDKHVQLRVKFTFIAEDGSSVLAVTEGEGLDSGDKATNKAMSGALKYALIQTLSIPTEDMEDADRTSPVLEQQVKQDPKQPQQVLNQVSTKAATPDAPTVATGGSGVPPTQTSPSSAPSTPRRSSSFRNRTPVAPKIPDNSTNTGMGTGTTNLAPKSGAIDEWS